MKKLMTTLLATATLITSMPTHALREDSIIQEQYKGKGYTSFSWGHWDAELVNNVSGKINTPRATINAQIAPITFFNVTFDGKDKYKYAVCTLGSYRQKKNGWEYEGTFCEAVRDTGSYEFIALTQDVDQAQRYANADLFSYEEGAAYYLLGDTRMHYTDACSAYAYDFDYPEEYVCPNFKSIKKKGR